MRKVVLASGNRGKVKEIQELLAPFAITVIPQSEFGIQSIEETAPTFIENALLKARHASIISQLPAIGDDSGLCVNVLKGSPGLYSARYAGDNASDEENWKKLLHELRDVPEEQRQAQFYCTMVYVSHPNDPRPLISQGICQGTILREPRGNGGFGYDPVFYVSKYNCAVAELSSEVKNAISHRGKALRGLVEQF